MMQRNAHLVLSMFGSRNSILFWIVILCKCRSQWAHLVCDLLHWISWCGCQSSGGIVSQFLTLGIIARFLKLHLEVVQETVVCWALSGRAPQSEATRGDIIPNELAMIGWLARQLYCTVFEKVLQHLLSKFYVLPTLTRIMYLILYFGLSTPCLLLFSII